MPTDAKSIRILPYSVSYTWCGEYLGVSCGVGYTPRELFGKRKILRKLQVPKATPKWPMRAIRVMLVRKYGFIVCSCVWNRILRSEGEGPMLIRINQYSPNIHDESLYKLQQ